MLLPTWGQKWCPLLPESLRTAWTEECIPVWVAKELGLPAGARFSSLGVEVWRRYTCSAVSDSIKRFLVNSVAARRSAILELPVLCRPWPRSLDTGVVPWSTRTRNCLRNSGLLQEPGRLSSLTYRDLLSLSHMGVVSLFDFACAVEVATPTPREATLALPEPAGDYVETLLAVIDTPWASQISHRDPRFSNLLSPGSETILERLDRLTAEPQDPPLAERQLAREVCELKVRMAEVEGLSLDVALAQFVESVTQLRGAKLSALIRRLGCGGEAPVTLEEAASAIGITRERLRQLQKRFTERLPPHPVFLPQLDAAIAVVREAAPLTVDLASDLLRRKNIAARHFHPKSLLAAAEFCGRAQPFEIDSRSENPRVVLEQRKDLERTILSIACKQAGASGATNVQEVIAEVTAKGTPSGTEEEVRRYLKDRPELEFLTDDWFWHIDGSPDRNRLCNVTRKMLSVATPIQLSELREGVQRHYRIRGTRGVARWPLITPPRAVLEAFYRAHPEFAVDPAGLVSSVTQLDYRIELNPTEKVLLEVLRRSPAGVLDHASFGKACADYGMNQNTFSQYLSSSPVIAHLGTDLWSVRGVKVGVASVEALRQANAAKPREKRIVETGWTAAGDIWFAARLPELHAGLVLGIPAAIRRFVAGKEFPAIDESGLPAGVVRINLDSTASYGYHSFLARSGADQGDLLLVVFSLTERQATLRLVNDEELEALSPTSG